MNSISPSSALPARTALKFDYQSECHCSKTNYELVFPKTAAEYHLPVDHSGFITLKQSDLRKIVEDHEISLDNAQYLDAWIEQHPLVLESLSFDNALVIFADARDIHGNEIIMSLHCGISAGQKDFEIFVDRTTSAYGKRSASNLIENTARAGKKIFVNEKHRIGCLGPGSNSPRWQPILCTTSIPKIALKR